MQGALAGPVRGGVPDLDRAVVRARHELALVHRQGTEAVCVSLECAHVGPSRRVPQPDGVVSRPRSERVPDEGNGVDATCVPLQSVQALAHLRIPDAKRHVT